MMGAILTYHLRRGIVSAVAGRELFHLPTQQNPSHVAAWEHQHDFRPGQYTLWDHAFVPPRTHNEDNSSRIHRAAAQVPAKIVKYRPHHVHFGPAIFIENSNVGFYIHGWPPCNLRRCVVITYGLEALFNALTLEDQLSFGLEY
jgi:hypothetical protein